MRVFQRLDVSAYFKRKTIFGDEHMRKNYFTVLIVIMTMFTTDVFANNECKSEATVTGTVDTINVSQSVQVGTIHLILSDDKGEVFNEKGGIIGRITSQSLDEQYRPIATLDHNIIFADGRIETTGDEAILSPLSECFFQVTETISNLWGTRFFKRASGEITAIGTISFCDGENGNHFDLSGTVCLK